MITSIQTANCGHTVNSRSVYTDYRGYTACVYCSDDDTDAALLYCNRITARLLPPREGMSTRVCSLTGLYIGTVIERVTNNGARTPTGGKYQSDRMTVQDKKGRLWYANAPKADGSDNLILRKAS